MTDITENDVYRTMSYIKWKIPINIKAEVRDRKRTKDPLPEILNDPIFKKVDTYISSLIDQGFIQTRKNSDGITEYKLKSKVKKE
jgi:hypothetical protein